MTAGGGPVAARDPYGRRRLYLSAQGRAWASSLAALALRPAAFDPWGVLGFLARRCPPRRSWLRGAEMVPPGWEVCQRAAVFAARPRAEAEPGATQDSLEVALAAALAAQLADAKKAGRRVALALSGGLDSAALLSLLARGGGELPPLYLLVTDLAGYCERREALATAAIFACPVREVQASPADFVAALPAALRAAEAPFYNLHLVGSLLLARALRRDGVDAVITGHSADQVLALASARATSNFLPWVDALFAAEGVELLLPFLDQRVLAAARSAGADPHKEGLRRILQGILPAAAVNAAKVPRLTPAFALASLAPAGRIPRLFAHLPFLRNKLPEGAAAELLLLSFALLGEIFGIFEPWA